jgi:hypothetical protein
MVEGIRLLIATAAFSRGISGHLSQSSRAFFQIYFLSDPVRLSQVGHSVDTPHHPPQTCRTTKLRCYGYTPICSTYLLGMTLVDAYLPTSLGDYLFAIRRPTALGLAI